MENQDREYRSRAEAATRFAPMDRRTRLRAAVEAAHRLGNEAAAARCRTLLAEMPEPALEIDAHLLAVLPDEIVATLQEQRLEHLVAVDVELDELRCLANCADEDDVVRALAAVVLRARTMPPDAPRVQTPSRSRARRRRRVARARVAATSGDDPPPPPSAATAATCPPPGIGEAEPTCTTRAVAP
jgi:hypothetical protein